MSTMPEQAADPLPEPSNRKLVVALSSRALFDLEEGHQVFTNEGVDAYCRYQVEHENELLEPGVAFPMVKKLLRLNALSAQMPEDVNHPSVEVILLSRNSADTGLRIFNSLRHYGLDVSRAAFTSGESPWPYIAPFGADLFLSTEQADVQAALDGGVAAATIVPTAAVDDDEGQLRIAFDGDAVLFSDEAERVYRERGLAEFEASEQQAALQPLPGGPFKSFLAALHGIQSCYDQQESPIRTALVTARGMPAHERVIRTLRAWRIRIDEAIFLGGKPKGPFLRSFRADIFFDDQQGHIDSASAEHVPAGHVPHGVANEGKA